MPTPTAEPWKIVYTKDALKDKKRAYDAGYENKIKKLLETIKEDPFAPYPPYEKLIGDLTGAYSRRINIQHRLVYMVYPEERAVKVIALWTHYE
jgi:toxin-antitoxin system, toxin component, Txe/YoeB family